MKPRSRTLKAFKSWLMWDSAGTYVPVLHQTRSAARYDCTLHAYRDAKWRIARVRITKVKP